MAIRKISELTSAAGLDGTETVEVVQSGNSRKAAIQSILDSVYPLGDPRRLRAVESGAVTINVPSDVATLQEAIDLYPRKVPGDVRTEINIETGFAPTAGIVVANGDWSHIRIVSEDATVTVHSSFTGHFLSITRAKGPQLHCLIDMDDKGNGGVFVDQGGWAQIASGCGCLNAGQSGLWARRQSRVSAQGSKWSGANGDACIVANEESIIDARLADASGAKGSHGVWAVNGGIIGCREADVTNSAGEGIRCDPSAIINAGGADVSGSTLDGFIAQGGFLHCRAGIANDCGGYGLRALNGSIVDATSGFSATGAGEIGIFATTGSYIAAPGSVATGASGAAGISAERGASIDATSSTASSAGFGYRVDRGGMIAADDGTGTLNIVPNFVTEHGIIYQEGVDDEPSFNTQESNYTFAMVDVGPNSLVASVSSSPTYTIPPRSSVVIPRGCNIRVYRGGAGTTTIEPGTGVTLVVAGTSSVVTGSGGGSISIGGGNRNIITLTHTATIDTWIASGADISVTADT